MEKNALEQFTPETENIIQWVNAFNYEEELNKVNKYDNIKITKSGIKITDFFEAVETAPKQQEKNKKCVEVAPRIKNNKLPLKFVWKHDRLQNFNNDDTKQEYIYFSKQVITPNNKLSFNFCEIKKESLNLFINDYLTSDNNLFEIIRPFNKVKLFFDLEYKLNEISINYKDVAAEKLNNTIQFIRIQADNILKINITNDDFIILDSCTPEKISFHLIINKIVFESLGAQKIFIQYLLNILSNDPYFYSKINNFIDGSVYEKNRNMRLINQSKINKNVTLKNNDVKIYDTLINVHEDINNYIKLDDIKHLENIKIITTKHKEAKTKENKTNKNINTNDNLNIYCPKFETLPKSNLKMIKNINDDDLKVFPYWKQYLYLINQPLNWEEYFKISCALARCENVTVEDFKEWAKLHPEYNDQDPEILNFDKKKTYKNEKGYNIFTLRKLAKICNPDFFKHNPDELNKILTDLNCDGYDVIIEETKYIDENNKVLFKDDKFILILAPMGKGKTQFITKYLLFNNKKSILFISTRKSFADFITNNDFKNIGLVNYQDFKGNNKDITKYNKIVCSLESLQDLKNIEKFDIVVLDESETIFNQLDSTTMKGKTLTNYQSLKNYINKAEKVFIADAFLSNRTINFTNNFKGDKTLIINEKPIINREAEEINENVIFNVLVESIKKGEKNYCCFGSERKMRKYINNILELEILERDEILYYSSSSDDNKTTKTLNNINEEWKKYKLILTTPTITVGCSFSELYFHNTFIIGYPSCNVRDIFQTHMRARNIINNKIYFSIPDPRKYNFIKSQANILLNIYDNYDNEINYNYELHLKLIEQYITNLKNNKILYEHIKDKELIRIDNYKESFIKNIVSETPEDLKQIKKYNLLERLINGLHYKYMFYYYLNKCNYKIINTNAKYTYFETDDNIYKEIDEDIINDETAKEIEEKIKQKKATEYEKNNLDKYYFNKFLNNSDIDIEIVDRIYNSYWSEKFKRSILKNTKNEIFNRYEFKIKNDDFYDKEQNIYTKDDIKNSLFKLFYINVLKEKLNISYTFETVKISREQINKCTDFLQAERENIYNVFNVVKKDRGTTELNFNTTLKLINLIFNNWNESKIIGDEEDYNKKKKIYNSYVLYNDTFINVFENFYKVKILDLFKNDVGDENYNYIPDYEDKTHYELEEELYKNYMFIDE